MASEDDNEKSDENFDYSSSSSSSNKKRTSNVNEEIESIKPFRFRPFLLHLNIGPFFAAYLIWFIVWSQKFGIEVILRFEDYYFLLNP